MFSRQRSLLAFIIATLAVVVSGCRNAALTPEQASAFQVVEPLQGETKTNQAALLDRIRHLPKKARWERRVFIDPQTNERLQYLLFRPGAAQAGTNLPLVLSLHGGAPRKRFEDLLEPFVPGLAYGLGRFISDETQQKYPSFVLAPWSAGTGWDDANIALALKTLDSLQREFRIDTNRVYVTGQSMGGWGTWSCITKHPERFAAAIPICGGGNPADAPRAKDIPIWAFHGTEDHVVPVRWTREMIGALHKAGAAPRYWEYRGEDHSGTAERAYCEPGLVDWLFAQGKGKR